MKFDKYCHKCISDMLGRSVVARENYYCLHIDNAANTIDMKLISELTEIPKNCPYRLEKLLNQF
jgi:hypothetical protein